MRASEHRKLKKLIAHECERAFRRGFQHGFHTGRGYIGQKIPNDIDVWRWRFLGGYDKAKRPPGHPNVKTVVGIPAVTRLGWEIGEDLRQMLIHLEGGAA